MSQEIMLFKIILSLVLLSFLGIFFDGPDADEVLVLFCDFLRWGLVTIISSSEGKYSEPGSDKRFCNFDGKKLKQNIKSSKS